MEVIKQFICCEITSEDKYNNKYKCSISYDNKPYCIIIDKINKISEYNLLNIFDNMMLLFTDFIDDEHFLKFPITYLFNFQKPYIYNNQLIVNLHSDRYIQYFNHTTLTIKYNSDIKLDLFLRSTIIENLNDKSLQHAYDYNPVFTIDIINNSSMFNFANTPYEFYRQLYQFDHTPVVTIGHLHDKNNIYFNIVINLKPLDKYSSIKKGYYIYFFDDTIDSISDVKIKRTELTFSVKYNKINNNTIFIDEHYSNSDIMLIQSNKKFSKIRFNFESNIDDYTRRKNMCICGKCLKCTGLDIDNYEEFDEYYFIANYKTWNKKLIKHLTNNFIKSFY